MPENRKSRKGKEIREGEEGLSAHLQRADQNAPNAAEMPPDLAAVATAWPHLPEAVKAGILAIARASAGDSGVPIHSPVPSACRP